MNNAETKEIRDQQFAIIQFVYKNPSEGKAVINNLSEQIKQQMAAVYQQAFGGKPWFEKFQCPVCQSYRPTSACIACGRTNLPDAYPTWELLDKEFPSMLSSFSPGILLIVTNASQEVVGFSTGGITTLKTLVDKKYDGNTTVLNDIIKRTCIQPSARVFYDNETCILPQYQQYGIGKKLSQARMDAAIQLNAAIICGRTINLPWLGLKEKQLGSLGYSFTSFTPNGDTYSVDGVKRQIYVATRMPERRRKAT